MQRVKIVDYFSQHTFHEVVNSSLVEICASCFEKVTYVSGKSAQNNMKRLLASSKGCLSNVHYHTMPTYDADTSWGARIRDVWGFFTTIYQYLITSSGTLFFCNYTNKLSLPVILALNILLKKRIVFVFHGELEFLIGKVSYIKTSGWYKKNMQFSFRSLFTHSPAYALVLGDSIKKNLAMLFPNMQQHILSICHPYILGNVESDNHLQQSRVIKIGTVGVLKESKGLKEYIALAASVKDLLTAKKLELYSIGKVYAGNNTLTDDIHWIGKESGLSRKDFETEIQKLDYLLYLYPTNSYKFTASGAILDAVKFHKPIIALHNDYFDFLIGEHPIGYVKDTLEEIERIIRQIVNEKPSDDFTEGFNALEKKITIESNSILLKQEFEKVALI